MSESFLCKHEHLESFDVGKAEVGVVRVQGSASIWRRDTSCSTFQGGLRGFKVCHQHLKLKGAPALIVTYFTRSVVIQAGYAEFAKQLKAIVGSYVIPCHSWHFPGLRERRRGEVSFSPKICQRVI